MPIDLHCKDLITGFAEDEGPFGADRRSGRASNGLNGSNGSDALLIILDRYSGYGRMKMMMEIFESCGTLHRMKETFLLE